MQQFPDDIFACHVCGGSQVAEEPRYRALHGVASDARPWPAGARIGQCRDCGMVVKRLDDAWRATIDDIYRSYVMYHQSGGAEKLSFDEGPERATPRSLALLRKVFAVAELPQGAHALDIGTGTGVLLQALSQVRPDMKLWAQDLFDGRRDELARIPNFQHLFAGDLATVEGTYDLASLVHVLEHVPEPVAFLARVRATLKPDGLLVVSIPDAVANPFDLLIVDHASHFTLAHLRAVVAAAGFEVLFSDNGLLARELVVIARPSPSRDFVAPDAGWLPLTGYVSWLAGVLAQARALAQQGPLAIFGASNAGTWLGAGLPDWRGVFVDEDKARVGNTMHGHPILAPAALPAGTSVYVPFTAATAQRIAGRLSTPGTPYVVPAPLPA